MELAIWSLLSLIALGCIGLVPIIVARVYHHSRRNGSAPAARWLRYVMYTLTVEVIMILLLELAGTNALRAAQLLPGTLAPETERWVTDLNFALICIGFLALAVGIYRDIQNR